MNKTIRFSAAAVAVAAAMGMSSVAHAQDNATASARAEILEALQLTEVTTLDFGAIVVDGTSSGNVVLGSDGVLNCGPFTCVGTTTPGRFDVQGSGAKVVDVTLPGAGANLVLTGPGDDIPLFGFNASADPVTLDPTGFATFDVGATITIADDQVAGVYTGNYQVSVAYQ